MFPVTGPNTTTKKGRPTDTSSLTCFNRSSMAGQKDGNQGVLAEIQPFSFLDKERREFVEQHLTFHHVPKDTAIVKRGQPYEEDSDICIIHSGAFVGVDKHGRGMTDVQLTKGCYFGVRAALFKMPRQMEIRAVVDSTVWRLKGELLMRLLAEHNPRFALALAANLRQKRGLFDNFLSFQAAVLSAIHAPGNRINLQSLLERYKTLKPAIHSLLDDPVTVDFDGWCYAIRRLPSDITSVYSIVLSRRVLNVLKVHGENDEDIPVCTSMDCTLNDEDEEHCSPTTIEELEFVVSTLSPGKKVLTAARRRTCWEVMPGKLFVLLRDITSDFLDIMTNLCLHSVEMRKLRSKLRPFGRVVPMLQKGLKLQEKAHDTKAKQEVERKVFSSTGCLSAPEIDGLQRIWPEGAALTRTLEMLIHHGDYHIYLDPSVPTYGMSMDERWISRVRNGVTSLMDVEDFTTDLTVDIISSNTHSVLNCLSPYIHQNREAILEWGKTHSPEYFKEKLHCEEDRLYPIAKAYFEANPQERRRAHEIEYNAGIRILSEREVTGVSVQLMDVNRLKENNRGFDELLPAACHKQLHGKHLLINIDYCFGSQAEHILKLLILTFGCSIRSINILGKAGGLTGSRGDILFPTSLLDEGTQGSAREVANSDLVPEVLQKQSGRTVHVGPVITVMGTLLQNRELLIFYEKLWHATGMEMEGSHYLKAVAQGQSLHILSPDVRTRVLYYVSDTPLNPESSLARSMSVMEGVPPLYAITRCLLEKVLDVTERTTPKTAGKMWGALRAVIRASAPTRAMSPTPMYTVDEK
eukprot:Sspe_Gene.6073::Locus_2035_Transcript_2_2_Confidence_0.667_Length_3909::g.6073::m.6073